MVVRIALWWADRLCGRGACGVGLGGLGGPTERGEIEEDGRVMRGKSKRIIVDGP